MSTVVNPADPWLTPADPGAEFIPTGRVGVLPKSAAPPMECYWFSSEPFDMGFHYVRGSPSGSSRCCACRHPRTHAAIVSPQLRFECLYHYNGDEVNPDVYQPVAGFASDASVTVASSVPASSYFGSVSKVVPVLHSPSGTSVPVEELGSTCCCLVWCLPTGLLRLIARCFSDLSHLIYSSASACLCLCERSVVWVLLVS